MTKNFIYTASALLLGSAITLTSCQSEEDFGQVAGSGERQVLLTINANRGEGDSRQSRTWFEVTDGDLVTNWSAGDKLVVTNLTERTPVSEYQTLGVIEIVEGQDTPTGVFQGTVTVPEGCTKINVSYLGSAYNDDLATSKGSITFDIANQDGTLSTGRDFLTSYDLDLNVIDGTATASTTLTRYLGYGYFELALPDNVTLAAGDVITITEPNDGTLLNHFSYNINYPTSSTNSNDRQITITKAKAGNDFWLAMVPQTCELKFTVVKDDVTYTATLGSHAWKATEYVRADENNTPVKITDWTYDAPGVVDHSKNPLAKWAESDLQRVGSGASATGTFTGDPTITGYYYQFGRNHGFSSVADAQSKYGVERSDMAANRNIYPGTGSTTVVPTYYATSINFTNYTDYFFIDNNHGGDYTTPSRGQTWNERAKSMGYVNENPSPAGWRLPTVAEYKEILPAIDGKAGNSGSNAWSTLSQFKTLADGTKCAFRWSKTTASRYSYLHIECLVVDKNLDNLDAVDWSDENVVSRYFKGNGYINAHRNLWQLTSSGVVSTHYTARPMAWGTYYGSVQTNGTVLVSVTDNYMNYGGFYWTSDAVQGIFSIIFNNSSGYTLGYYLSQYDSPMGANIRCIKAD